MPVYKQRRGTSSSLAAANETPAEGQIIFEIDTNRIKIGDGVKQYQLLPYLSTQVTISGVTGLQAALDGKPNIGSVAAVVHTHTASQITDFSSAVAAVAPATTNASLLVSGTLDAARLPPEAVLASDVRLSNSRQPVAHAATHSSGGSDAIAISGEQITSGTVSLSRLPTIPVGNVSGLGSLATQSSVAYSSITGTPAPYTLPVATASVLGGVKQGTGVTIDASGVISATGGGGSSYTLPPATSSVLGGVKIGANVSVAADGTISVAAPVTSLPYSSITGTPSPYTLPTATASVLGGVKIGTGISIDGAGVISAASSYTLPQATTSTLGGVIVGSGLSVSSGTVSVTYPILVYATSSAFPATGNTAFRYLASDESREYQWTGSQYVEIGSTSSQFVNHAATHSSGGADPISIAASQVTSGTFAYARMPVGAVASTVCAGDDSRIPSGPGQLVVIPLGNYNFLNAVNTKTMVLTVPTGYYFLCHAIHLIYENMAGGTGNGDTLARFNLVRNTTTSFTSTTGSGTAITFNFSVPTYSQIWNANQSASPLPTSGNTVHLNVANAHVGGASPLTTLTGRILIFGYLFPV